MHPNMFALLHAHCKLNFSTRVLPRYLPKISRSSLSKLCARQPSCTAVECCHLVTFWFVPLEPDSAVNKIVAAAAETDLEAEVDPSVETEEKLRAEEEAAKARLEAMQRCDSSCVLLSLSATWLISLLVRCWCICLYLCPNPSPDFV